MTARDRERLVGVHPALLVALTAVLSIMADMGQPMFIVEGVRSLARQRLLYGKGRTTKGPIVTYADGVIKPSNHQIRADGFGHAVDLAFVGAEPFAASHPWRTFGRVAKEAGLIWGGDFSRLVDQPHVEWKETPV